MTRKRVADDKYGQLQRKLGEYARRIDEGTLELEPNLALLQLAIEGKLINLIKSGGLVLSMPLSVLVEHTGEEVVLDENGLQREISKELRDSLFLPCEQKYRIDLQFAHFEFFGAEQPGTEEVVSALSRRGFRQASAVELSCAIRQHKLTSAETTYVLALDSPAAGLKQVACFERKPFIISRGVTLARRDHPWWPYCYRFAVVEMKK